MSLKAKLEAAIYAAEEPVTLNQLAALFADDALEWKASREAEPATDAAPLVIAEVDEQRMEQATADGLADAAARAGEADGPELDRVGEDGRLSGGVPETVPAGAEAHLVLHDELPGINPRPTARTAQLTAGETLSADGNGRAGGIEAAPEGDAGTEAKRLARVRDRQVRTILLGLLDELIAGYASDDRGIEIKEIAGGYRMATKPECHDAARMFVKSLKPALKLSLPALETLAVIAYKQPVTAPEVNEIRGVDSSGVFGSLLARKLIATAGRKQVIGRPILYKTTREFLLRFGLKDVTELPSMEEFEKLAQLEFEGLEASGEVEEPAAAAGVPTLEVDEEPEEARDEPAAQLDTAREAGFAEPEPPTSTVGKTAAHPDPLHAGAAPAAVSHSQEQAETETVPHE